MMFRFFAALVAAFFMSGCSWWEQKPTPPWWPPGTETPTPTPVELPSEPEPTATPTPKPEAKPFQMRKGFFVLESHGTHLLPLGDPGVFEPDRRSFATITWETAGKDRSWPVLELLWRGLGTEPCLKSPCRDREVGLVARWSSNLVWDRRVYQALGDVRGEPFFAGAGINHHRRLATGPWLDGELGRVDVLVELDIIDRAGTRGLRVSTGRWDAEAELFHPVDSWSSAYRHGCQYGLGRVVWLSPWPRAQARGWAWDQHSDSRLSGRIAVWDGAEAPPMELPCWPDIDLEALKEEEVHDGSGPW